MLAFATDLYDEGLDTVLGNVQERAAVDGLTMAVAYHDARDLFPHNPVHKVRYLEGGAVFFQPDESRYEGLQLQPRVADLARTVDPLSDVCAAAGEQGMDVNAWVVFLHSDRLGFTHPQCATQNAFGDRRPGTQGGAIQEDLEQTRQHALNSDCADLCENSVF